MKKAFMFIFHLGKKAFTKVFQIKYINERWLVYTSLVLFAISFFMPIKHVVGESMLPTLKDDSYYYSLKTKNFEHGDIVAIKRNNNNNMVKRIIGMPGDKITINETNVILNGEVLDEPYLSDELKQAIKNKETIYDENHQGTTVLPDGYVFILGDNRRDSLDSRLLGPYPIEVVEGKFLQKVLENK